MTLSPFHWHDITQAAFRSLPPLDVVSPFGFELLGAPAVAARQVARFYLYFRSEFVSEQALLHRLLAHLRSHWPEIHARVAVIGSRRLGAIPLLPELTPQDYFIHVEQVDTPYPVLRAHARYMAGAVHAMGAGYLPELAKIERSGMARLRIRQLFLISQSLHPGLADCVPDGMARVSPSPAGVDPMREQPITPEERIQITQIVEACRRFIATPAFTGQAAWRDFDLLASGRRQRIAVNPGLFDRAAALAETRHRAFYAEAREPAMAR